MDCQPAISPAPAWYKLMTRDMGPRTRCLGKWVAPAQPWQMPLPEPTKQLLDFNAVKADILKAISTQSTAATPDTFEGKADYGPLFATLAYQCASTFRRTDYAGGCNGARCAWRGHARTQLWDAAGRACCWRPPQNRPRPNPLPLPSTPKRGPRCAPPSLPHSPAPLLPCSPTRPPSLLLPTSQQHPLRAPTGLARQPRLAPGAGRPQAHQGEVPRPLLG
jgi:hypothetical protein